MFGITLRITFAILENLVAGSTCRHCTAVRPRLSPQRTHSTVIVARVIIAFFLLRIKSNQCEQQTHLGKVDTRRNVSGFMHVFGIIKSRVFRFAFTNISKSWNNIHITQWIKNRQTSDQSGKFLFWNRASPLCKRQNESGTKMIRIRLESRKNFSQ